MKPRKSTKNTISVGTLVKFMWGGNEVQATVIEDRGPVGAKGRRILRVRLDIEGTDPLDLRCPRTM